ncbi:MAG: phenylalanine--tRNA ligase beta subunit [Phycisphaerae bacterium]|nr:MAG: phenylalanine--tRNA ligase beta subunit [Phycisphaerae bacterium]
MLVAISNLRRYLQDAADLATVEHALVAAGFPVESRTSLDEGDVRLDVEITSNRGDCLSHLGLAREAAAQLGMALRRPSTGELPGNGGPIGSSLILENTLVRGCPRFTARVIRGVKIGPSPAWLRKALEAVGQRSINNVVDVTNFVAGEFGNPCHVFDLARLAGARLVVRLARAGEKLTTLDGKSRTLDAADMVVADAERAQSLAGIIGGQDSEVTDHTTDVVLEMATWDPVAVRQAARRHQVRTDASHRFERLVDPRTIDEASARATALILEVAGGRLCDGMLDAGAALQPLTCVRLRPSRCRALLGIDLTTEEMVRALSRLEITVEPIGRAGEELRCTVPAFRPDLTREADLIEEVARVVGYGRVPVRATMPVAVGSPQASEGARRELGSVLAGLGFFEGVTFSFTSPAHAAAFCPEGLRIITIDDARRGDEPALRPSVLTGLLACRRRNLHAMVHSDGGVRLFEIASVFGEQGSATVEHQNVGLLLDVPVAGKAATRDEVQHGVRLMRGAIEALTGRLSARALAVEQAPPHAPAFDPGAYARLTLGGRALGYLGVIAPETQRAFELAHPVVGAELNLAVLVAEYPPVAVVSALPAYPGIERDLSLIVGDETPWSKIEAVIRRHAAGPFVGVSFVGTYRGKQIGEGRKSVTVRLGYREADRTLRHEEVDAPVASLVASLRAELGAELRA